MKADIDLILLTSSSGMNDSKHFVDHILGKISKTKENKELFVNLGDFYVLLLIQNILHLC